MIHAINKVRSTGNDNVWLTERGSMFGMGDLVVDPRQIVDMKDLGVPVIDELLIGLILCIHLNTLKYVERGGGIAQVVTVAQHRRPLLLLVILLLVILLSVLMLTLPLPTISSR